VQSRDPYRRRITDIEHRAPLDVGRPWWMPRRPWPDGMKFTDVDHVLLDIERLVDNAPLGPPEAPPGSYGCSARMASESRFAEAELEPAVSVTVAA
jgi:hypothetical protein